MESVKKRIRNIDQLIEKAKKIEHEGSRKGMLAILKANRDKVVVEIGRRV